MRVFTKKESGGLGDSVCFLPFVQKCFLMPMNEGSGSTMGQGNLCVAVFYWIYLCFVPEKPAEHIDSMAVVSLYKLK